MDRVAAALVRRARKVVDVAATRLGLGESEVAVARDAQALWNPADNQVRKSDAHWRGAGTFANDDVWLAIGRDHLALYRTFTAGIGFSRPLRRIVDWGCGGGANAVQFGPLAEEYVGVDVSTATLEECAREAVRAGTARFLPVLIDVADPEAAVALIDGPADLFICTFVLELVPSQAYGLRLLRIAERLLAPGGIAFVQIKYDTGSWRTASFRRSYRRNFAAMTTYRLDAFWRAASACGLTPRLMSLVPDHVLDARYAYFLLEKPPAPA
jgi:SAM-dependent methyltransferase